MRYSEFKIGCTYESVGLKNKFKFKKVSDHRVLWLSGVRGEYDVAPNAMFVATYRKVGKRHRRHT